MPMRQNVNGMLESFVRSKKLQPNKCAYTITQLISLFLSYLSIFFSLVVVYILLLNLIMQCIICNIFPSSHPPLQMDNQMAGFEATNVQLLSQTGKWTSNVNIKPELEQA